MGRDSAAIHAHLDDAKVPYLVKFCSVTVPAVVAMVNVPLSAEIVLTDAVCIEGDRPGKGDGCEEPL